MTFFFFFLNVLSPVEGLAHQSWLSRVLCWGPKTRETRLSSRRPGRVTAAPLYCRAEQERRQSRGVLGNSGGSLQPPPRHHATH